MTISSIQSGYEINYQKNSSNNTFNEKVEEVSSSKIIDYRKLSNEEAKNLYYTHKENNLMKSKIEIYMNIQEENEENKLDYNDIREIQKTQNKIDLTDYYSNNAEINKETTSYQVWA